jgi:cell division protein FtsZ
VASGENRAVEAAQRAISSPLLEDNSIKGARGILINITGSSTLLLHEVHEASTIIHQEAHEDANIIFGAVLNEAMGDEIKITVIATGFRSEAIGGKRARAAAERAEGIEPAAVPAEPRDELPARQAVANSGAIAAPVVSPPAATTPPAAARPAPPAPTAPPAPERPRSEEALPPITSDFDPDDLDVPTFLRRRKESAQ